ncbi:MAG TPA: helix-turn-helix domain-containing protein [Urbifossiella sp.]|jgi:predicted DNA-binding transcriptional regulator AlpA|nr:helix-turn-helix domain-containing protein [Urbifossiella sp.]
MADPLHIHTPAAQLPGGVTLSGPAPVTSLVVDAKALAALLGVGVRTVRTWDAGGKLPKPVRLGGRVVWRLDEVRAWLDADAPDRATWATMRAAGR